MNRTDFFIGFWVKENDVSVIQICIIFGLQVGLRELVRCHDEEEKVVVYFYWVCVSIR